MTAAAVRVPRGSLPRKSDTMHLVIILLALLTLFIYLTLGARRDPERRNQFYLFVLIDLWLAGVFLYLLVSAVLDFN